MCRHESRRGAKVTGEADLEGVEPRKSWLVSADGFDPPNYGDSLLNELNMFVSWHGALQLRWQFTTITVTV
jgi:hypothetical protein